MCLLKQRSLATLAIALAVIIADLAIKWLVQAEVLLGERITVIPGVLELTHIRNTGAAYGIFAGQRWLLVITAAVIAALTPFLLRVLPPTGHWRWTAPLITGLILGGASGNLAERVRAGYVTDYLTMPPVPLFQVFNFADACISVAVTALLVLSLFDREPRTAPPAATAPPLDQSPEPPAPMSGATLPATGSGEAATEPPEACPT